MKGDHMRKATHLLLLVAFMFVLTGLSGCTRGLDPQLAEAQTKPLYDYTKPLVDEHEQDPMKKEDFEKLWEAWFKNIEKAKGGE